MSMFTLQTLGLILLFGLIGLLVGWLIRSFFCKPDISGGNANLSGSAKGGTTAKMGSADTSVKSSVDTSYAKDTKNASTSGASASVDATAGGSGTLNKTATAAAGIAAVAATAAAMASSKKDAVVDTASDAVDSVAGSVSGSIDAVTGSASDAMDSASATVSGSVETATSAVSGAVDSASGAIDSASGAASGAIETASKEYWGATDAASGSVSGAVDAASNVADSASESVSSGVAVGAAGAAALAAAAYSTSSSADESSSTTDSPQQLREEAETMLKQDFTGSATEAENTIPGAVDTASDSASGAIDTASDAVGSTLISVSGSAVDSAGEAISGAASSAANTGATTISNTTDSDSSGISGAAGVAGAAALAAAAYSANSSADDSNTASMVNAGTATEQGIAGSVAQGTSHIIIGAGPAGIIAAETIRKLDSTAIITVIGDEPEAPYSRMAIPYFLEENIQAEGTHLRKTDNHFENADIQIISGRVKAVDTESKQVHTANGMTLDYDKLLIATGSHPLTPPIPGLDNPKVGNCWDLADSRKIIENVKPGSSVVQIGAGFIGCIILESLVKRGAKLTVVEMDNRMVPRMLDDQCGGMLKSWCESKGVSVLTETMVQSIEDNGDRLKVNLSKGEAIDADYVISATGVASNTAFLEGSGINVDQGVLVNHHLESNIPGVYAAGDVAQGIDFTTGGYSVHAIQPTAADHGTISAKNMVKGNTTRHKGSLQMNILSTLDLISTSYGAWEGVEGGEHTELVDQDKYRYIRLQFKDDQLVGANTLGITQNIGALRGLIQSKSKLGVWKERLMENPQHFMDAYVALTGNHS